MESSDVGTIPLEDDQWLEQSLIIAVDDGVPSSNDQEGRVNVTPIESTVASSELDITTGHNKPKKSLSTPVSPEDYCCTKDDLEIIEQIKIIPSLPGKERVVQIDDTVVTRDEIECLFKPYDLIDDQGDMENFREKLAAILLSSDLNKLKGCPQLPDEVEEHGSPSDVVIIDKPCNTPSKVVVIEKSCNTAIKRKQPESPHVSDGTTELCSMLGLPIMDMPKNKDDFIHVVCDYILNITDVNTLQTWWVKSFQPYTIDLTVKDLQELLQMGKPMAKKCFNMAVRVHAYTEIKRLGGNKNSSNMTNHYMDLTFFELSVPEKSATTDIEQRKKALAETCKPWSFKKYDVSSCRNFFLPWAQTMRSYMLYVLDHKDKSVTVLDTSPIPSMFKRDTLPYKRYIKNIIKINTDFNIAMKAHCPDYHGDIFMWETIFAKNIPVDTDRSLSGFRVLQLMAAWNNGKLAQINMDERSMRMDLVIKLLTYDGNSRYSVLPIALREALKRSVDKS